MTSTRSTAAKLYHELHLEIQHISDGIAYSVATSKCDDCPHRNWADYEPQSYSELEFGVHIAETCCYDDPDYFASDQAHIDACRSLMEILKAFAGDEEIAAAQTKVAQHGT